MVRIEEMRRDIDEIDSRLIDIICRRVEIAKEIAKLKRELGMDIEDDEREKEVLENCKRSAKGNLSEEFVEDLMNLILSYSKKIQSP